MAVTSAGFKQMCPTCETMVLIKDLRQVGKKMECPKCKDRFIVEAPAEEEADKGNGKPQAKANGKAAPAAKAKAKRFREDDDDDDDAGAPEAKGKGKFREEEEDESPAKKKSGSKKMLPIILAGVGLVVLIVAAVLILMNTGGGDSTPKPPAAANNMGNVTPPKMEEKKDDSKKDEKPAPTGRGLPAAGAELTNLLPNETEHVLHVNFRDVLDNANPYRDLIFGGGGAFQDDDLKRKLGFSLVALDTLIRAERFSSGGWTYSVLHFTESLDQNAMKDAYGLKQTGPINNKHYFQATKANPWFNEFSRLSLGVALAQRNLTPKQNRAMYMHFHNPQTLIVGDETPILAFLKANSQFKLLTDLGPAAAPNNPQPGVGPGPMPGMAPMPGGAPGANPGGLTTPPQPGALPGGQPGAPPGGLPGPGPAPMLPPMKSSLPSDQQNVGSQDDGNVFGEPQGAQVGQTVIAPPLQQQQQPMQPPMGGQPAGPGAMGQAGPMGGQMMPNMPNMPNMPGMNPQGQQQNTAVRSETWLTIDPALKALLDRMQTRANEAKDKVLFASATDMTAARIDTSRMLDLKNRVLWHARQLWDITVLLEERKPRIKALGTALVQRETRNFQYRSELVCAVEKDAKELGNQLTEKSAPQVARSIERLLGHTVEVPTKEAANANANFDPEGGGPFMGPMGGMPPGGMLGPKPGIGPMGGNAPPIGPMPGAGPMDGMDPMGGVGPGMPGFNPNQATEELAKSSKLTFTVRGSSVDMKLDLVFDPSGYARLNNLVGLLALTLKSEVDLAGGSYSRHDLGAAVKVLGERGLSERGVAPGRYPPAALKRTGSTRLEQLPYQRMSWLTGLLPYMGHDALYQKIDFESSWQDPKNWLAARTIVPQFLDPQYPDSARFASPPDVGVEMATTHVVGIAGVGLDAADYPRDDPAFVSKRGVFGYDGSASLEEIRSGRGLSNVAVAIQIPHDGPTGVSPYMAGGGATVRGVPEKNSIAPFVLSTDRSGKQIQHNGKRGTYVTMADGSVRFVTANVSDEVFQAMCTVKGPAPKDFDLFKNPDTPLVPRPKVEDKQLATDRKPVGEKAPAVTGLPAGWNTFKIPGGDFSVGLPGQPKLIEQAIFAGGPRVKLLLAGDLTTQNGYVVMQIPMDPDSKAQFGTNPDQVFRDIAGKISGITGQAIPEKQVTQNGLQGRQFSVDVAVAKDKKQLLMRIFASGDNLVILQATSDDATPPRHAQAFFESFRLGNAPVQLSAANLTPEAKAFHEGVLKTMQEWKALETKFQSEMLKIKEAAQLQTMLDNVTKEATPLFQRARQLKAPSGKAAQDYQDAFNQFIDFQEKSLKTDGKRVIDLLQARPPDLLTQLTQLATEAQKQEQVYLNRLQTAQQAFLQSPQATAAVKN